MPGRRQRQRTALEGLVQVLDLRPRPVGTLRGRPQPMQQDRQPKRHQAARCDDDARACGAGCGRKQACVTCTLHQPLDCQNMQHTKGIAMCF